VRPFFSSSFLCDCGPTGQHNDNNKNTAFRLSIEQVDIQTLLFFLLKTMLIGLVLTVEEEEKKRKEVKMREKEMSYDNRKYSDVLINCP
jgi:hypothetical protein